MTRNNHAPILASKAFQVVISYDGTDTVVSIFTNEPMAPDTLMATGRARRMKGDERSLDIGVSLATGRAFEELARREFEHSDKLLNPEPPPPAVVPEWLRDVFGGWNEKHLP